MIKSTSNSEVQISVVIVTYNSNNYLLQCIQSILKSQVINITEIIVIDNNSDDKSEEIIELIATEIKFIPNKINVGFAAACNQGILLAKGKYVFLLNPDTILLNDILKIFTDFMEMDINKNVWCVGSQLLNENSQFSKSFGRFPNLIDVFSEQFGIKGLILKISFVRKIFRNPNLTKQAEVHFIMGCNMFIRSIVLEKIGLFDERFFLNFEETELAWRAKKAGYKCLVLPKAKIIHYSGKSFSNLKIYLSHLWYGQLIFFKITHSKTVFYTAKLFHLCGSFLRLSIKFDKFYFVHIKKIWSIKF